ncbi:hypothetical protein D3C86_1970700 [compost metagenome]
MKKPPRGRLVVEQLDAEVGGRVLVFHELGGLEHQDNVGDLRHLPRVTVFFAISVSIASQKSYTW